jgi:hypothetical protein
MTANRRIPLSRCALRDCGAMPSLVVRHSVYRSSVSKVSWDSLPQQFLATAESFRKKGIFLGVPTLLPSLCGFPCFKHVHNITNLPKSRRNLGGHRRRHPQLLMDANEIVVQREQRDRMRVVWHNASFRCAANVLDAIGVKADIARASRACRSEAITSFACWRGRSTAGPSH